MKMNTQSDASATAIKGALYNFLKYQMEFDADRADVLTPEGGLDPNSLSYPIIWHEYIHYLQSITTTIGSRIFLNWFAVMVRFSQTVHQRTPLLVPLRFDTSQTFSHELLSFMSEIDRLMGLSVPLDSTPPANLAAFSPYLDAANQDHAYLCLEKNGVRRGVPLYGNVFVESMAQAVQWLAENDGSFDEDALINRKIDGSTVYYDAITRYFQHHYPSINPCIPTILVSNAALQTTQPAAFFVDFHKDRPCELINSSDWVGLSNHLKSLSIVKNGVTQAIEDLARFESENSSCKGDKFFDMVLAVVGLSSSALNSYLKDEDFMFQLRTPSPQGIQELSELFHFPPLYSRDITSGWSISLPEPYLSFYMVSSSLFSLVFDVNNTPMQKECPLLRKQYCTFRKNKKKYCHLNRLDFIDDNGRICSMGMAAQLLSLYGKVMTRARSD